METMREVTYVSKQKHKKVFQMSSQEFRVGKWCSDRNIIPDGNMVEIEYTARNGILIVHNTTDLKVKKLISEKEEKKNG